MNLTTAVQWAADKLLDSDLAVEITYTRGNTTLPLSATVGRTLFVSNQINRARAEWGERDYLFRAADLVAAGLSEPEEGDRIGETIAGVAMVFELMAPGGEPAWRYSDSQRVQIRAHCKRVI